MVLRIAFDQMTSDLGGPLLFYAGNRLLIRHNFFVTFKVFFSFRVRDDAPRLPALLYSSSAVPKSHNDTNKVAQGRNDRRRERSHSPASLSPERRRNRSSRELRREISHGSVKGRDDKDRGSRKRQAKEERSDDDRDGKTKKKRPG